jgi:outer membrane protein assembly factor BamB
MKNLLFQFANNTEALIGLGVFGAVLVGLAVVLAVRREKKALVPGVLGILALAVIGLVLSYHPEAIAGDSEAFEKITGVEMTVAALSREDWPQWRGVNRDGIGKAPGLLSDWSKTPPKQLWTAPCGGGYSSLAITGGRVYTQDFKDGNERVICLDAETGKERWVHAYAAPYSKLGNGYAGGPRATPTVHDGRIYTVGATGMFLCLEAPLDRPKLLWQHDLTDEFNGHLPQWGLAGSPLVEGDLVVVQPGGKDGSVAAFHRVTGEKVWSALVEAVGYSSPVAATMSGERQLLVFTGARLVGMRPKDGKELWSYTWQTSFDANIATPLVAGDLVFISSGYNHGCALLKIVADGGAFKAEEVFVRRNKLMRNHHMTCVFKDGFIYGYDDGRNELKCVDLRTAKEAWSTNKLTKGCLILAEGHLLVMTQDGTLALVEATPDAFRLKGTIQGVLTGSDCWALPALADGRLYVRDHAKVVCLQVRQ